MSDFSRAVGTANKYADGLALGFSSVTDMGNGVVRFTLTDGGGHIDVTVPTVKGDKGDDGDSATITVGTVTESSTMSVTNVGTEKDAILNFGLKKGEKGDTGNRGATGTGISSIAKQSTTGLTDTYLITFTDGSTTTFDIVNGANITKTSQLTNDSNFVDSSTINLTNYYLKTEVYNKSAVDELLRNVGAGLSVKIVTELPTDDISGTTIYLINTSGSQYNQYMYIDSQWANLGSTSVDMSSYYNKTQIDNKLLEYITASAMLSQLLQYTKTSDLADVAISNSYNDLDDLPEIPSTDGFMKSRENLGEVDLNECITDGLFAVTTTSNNLPPIDIYGTYVALDVLTTHQFANQLVKLVGELDDGTLEPMIWSRAIVFEDNEWGAWHQAYSDITAYNKSEVNTLLDAKADKSTTYTKTETDDLLDDKADSDDVYTKTETDALLDDKADNDKINAVMFNRNSTGCSAEMTLSDLILTLINNNPLDRRETKIFVGEYSNATRIYLSDIKDHSMLATIQLTSIWESSMCQMAGYAQINKRMFSIVMFSSDNVIITELATMDKVAEAPIYVKREETSGTTKTYNLNNLPNGVYDVSATFLYQNREHWYKGVVTKYDNNLTLKNIDGSSETIMNGTTLSGNSLNFIFAFSSLRFTKFGYWN